MAKRLNTRNLGRVVPRVHVPPAPIDPKVTEVLETVRRSGLTNMADRIGVIQHAMNMDLDSWAIMWLHDNKNRYVEALQAMVEAKR